MKKFKKVYIEITNVCNLACKFCPPTKRQSEFMELELFNKILDQIKPHTNYVYFHVKGEPLLHPQIDRFLDVSYQKGFKVNITTNGTLINKVKDKILMKPALRQINFSLHSFDGNDYVKEIDEYVSHIFSFIREAIEKTDILISLRLWNLGKDDIVNLQSKRNELLLELIEKEYNIPYKIEPKVIPSGGIKISDRIYLNQDYEFKWPDLKEADELSEGFCYGLRNQVAILVDGTVVPCCLDGEGIINLGNINESSFSEIIDGNRANNIYNGFSRRRVVEELCRKCGYRRRFD